MNQNAAIRTLLAFYTALFLAFLYGPFVVMAIISFQQGPEGGPQFPIIEWSTFWYKHVLGFAPPSRVAPLPIGEALTRSLTLAFATMVVSTVLGTLTAQAFRSQFKGSGVVFYLVVLGMMVPGVLLGLGMALVCGSRLQRYMSSKFSRISENGLFFLSPSSSLPSVSSPSYSVCGEFSSTFSSSSSDCPAGT